MRRSSLNLILIGGALLVTVLFFIERNRGLDAPERLHELKPSDLNFKEGNKLQKKTPVEAKPEAEPAPTQSSVELLGAPPPSLSPEDKKKFEILREVLKSKNDSDPRLDKELKNLNSELRRAFIEAYQNIPMQKRNERGMIVFLVARDLQNEADIEFLKKVFEEPPCTSFVDCRQVDSQNSHMSGVNETSLNYPQLADLYQLERRLQANPELLNDPHIRDGIVGLLNSAENFPVPAVKNKAAELRRKLNL